MQLRRATVPGPWKKWPKRDVDEPNAVLVRTRSVTADLEVSPEDAVSP